MKRENILQQKVISYIETIIRYCLRTNKRRERKNTHDLTPSET